MSIATPNGKVADPVVTGIVSTMRAGIFRLRNFWERHRILSASLLSIFLVGISYFLVTAPAHAADSDPIYSFRDAVNLIYGENRDVSDSVHFLAWHRWTGFTPSSGTYYLTSAGSAASVVTNTISTIFFSLSGLILKMTGLLATIGLSFNGVENVMDMATINMLLVGGWFFPGLKEAKDVLCTESSKGCGGPSVGISDGLTLLAVVMLVGIGIAVFKRNGMPGSKQANANAGGGLGPGVIGSMNMRQIGMSVGSLLLLAVMTFSSAAEVNAGYFNKNYSSGPTSGVPGASSTTPLSKRPVTIGSPRWFASSIDGLATWAGSIAGDATEFTSVVLTGQSLKTGPMVGGACSDYVGTLHLIFQNYYKSGATSSPNRDQFLVALDELALNSYFRLIVNSSYGSIEDVDRSGVGNAWCHALESDAGISGAEHMLVTRIALAANDSNVASMLEYNNANIANYPLATSIDRNINLILSADSDEEDTYTNALNTFSGLKSMENMWGPYTSPETARQAKFYFAACNTSSPNPQLLDTWGEVISADAIKVGDASFTSSEGVEVAIPIGGTKMEKIYLDGSETIGNINERMKGHGQEIGICGAIPLGLYMRDPEVDDTPGEPMSFMAYIGAKSWDSTLGNAPIIGSVLNGKLEAASKVNTQETLKTSSDYYRSRADYVMSTTDGEAEAFNLLGSDGGSGIKAATSRASMKIERLSVLDEQSVDEAIADSGGVVMTPISLYNTVYNYNGSSENLGSTLAGTDGSEIDSEETIKADKQRIKDIDKGLGLGGKVWNFMYRGANQAWHLLSPLGGGMSALSPSVNEADTDALDPSVDRVIQAAVTGFTPGGLSVSNSMNWREPDVEFLGMGIKKMSSAAPLFVNAIETGPYDYYTAIVGGNTPNTLISSVFSLVVAIAMGMGMLPIIAGMVISKLIAILAWFVLPFALLINIWPSPKVRALLKLSVYTIIWSYFSVVFFSAILKVMTMLIIVFNSIIYNPSHHMIVQTIEIMISILVSFAITSMVLKNFFKIDLTSFKGAVQGAAFVSGHAIMDKMGKSTGILKDGDGFADTNFGNSFKDMGNALKDKYLPNGANEKKEASESEDSAQKVLGGDDSLNADGAKKSAGATNAAGTPGTTDTKPSQYAQSATLDQDAEGGELATALGTTLANGDLNGPKKTDDEVSSEASGISDDIGLAGIESTDEIPSNPAIAFDSQAPGILALTAEAEGLNDEAKGSAISQAFSDTELLSGGENIDDAQALAFGNAAVDPMTGGATPVQDGHTQSVGNPPLGFDNPFQEMLTNGEGVLSDDDKDVLTHASSLLDKYNSMPDASFSVDHEDAAWIDQNEGRLQSIVDKMNTPPVASSIEGFAGASQVATEAPLAEAAVLDGFDSSAPREEDLITSTPIMSNENVVSGNTPEKEEVPIPAAPAFAGAAVGAGVGSGLSEGVDLSQVQRTLDHIEQNTDRAERGVQHAGQQAERTGDSVRNVEDTVWNSGIATRDSIGRIDDTLYRMNQSSPVMTNPADYADTGRGVVLDELSHLQDDSIYSIDDVAAEGKDIKDAIERLGDHT